MFPVPESSWMGDFAVSIAISYQVGTARGDRSILSAMDIRDNELFAAFGQSINDLILRHRKDLERKRQATSAASEPKGRWVDGTPEYSLHIRGLRKLFPEALFVHICRDVRAVVRSMLNFHRVAGIQLVPNEEKAYKYWLRTVSACIEAEKAYGPSIVYRIRYSDLISDPESAMRSLLDFLQEPYTGKCLEPLGRRINSSNVPDDFVADDPATDPALVEQATRLSAELETTPQASEPSPAAADAVETAFQHRTQYVATLDKSYKDAQRLIRALEKQDRKYD
jgi:Sulfotransferase family